MDTEQLKIVVDLIRGISGDAQGAFIWYLVITTIPAMLTKVFVHGLWAGGIYLTIKAILGGVRAKLETALT